MKKLATAVCFTFVGLSSFASAGEYTVYSSSEFCSLERTKSTQLDDRYLKAYAKKLGSTPTRQLCQEIQNEQYSHTVVADSKWNYFQNKPYKGSIFRLSNNAVILLQTGDVEARHLLD